MARILITDDEPCFLRILSRVLSDAGHLVEKAGNGTEARRRLAADDQFDMVLTDIFMPEGDGLELIQSLRQNGRRLPIIAMSGGGFNGKMDYLPYARCFGANVVLRKPFSMSTLVAEVTRLLGMPMPLGATLPSLA